MWCSTEWMWIKSSSVVSDIQTILFEHLSRTFYFKCGEMLEVKDQMRNPTYSSGLYTIWRLFLASVETKKIKKLIMNPWGRNRNSFPSKALFHHLFVYHTPPLSSCGAACSLLHAVPEPPAPPVSIIHPPTLHSSLWTRPAWKHGDRSAAVMTGEIKWKGMRE